MAFCTKCGTNLPNQARVCPACGSPVDQAWPGTPADPYSQNQEPFNQKWSEADGTQTTFIGNGSEEYVNPNQTPPAEEHHPASQKQFLDGVVLADGEKIVRQYYCTHKIFPPANGYVTVTNQRVLFQSKKFMSRVNQEVTLDSISALDCYSGLNVSLLPLLFGLYFLLGGVGSIVSSMVLIPIMAGFGVIYLLLAALLLFLAFRKTLVLRIYSSKAIGVPISIGCGPKSLFGNSAIYSLKGRPTYDTDRMINELGALIHDLQIQGDEALSKWG